MMKHIFLFLLICLSVRVNAQHELKFVRYTTQQGLSHNDVLCVYQDHLGFMWFGTKQGCSRFDGMEFKTYQYNENVSGAIGQGWVTQIVSDNKNRLWFTIAGQGSTFMRYDYESDKFIDLTPSLKTQLDLHDELISFWNIFPDSDGYLWLATVDKGFMNYNPETGEVKKINNDNIIPSINDFYEDTNGNIWFATYSGIFIYDKTTGLFTNYKNDPKDPQSLSSDNCNRIFQDSENNIWIGTYNGLCKLISLINDIPKFKRFYHDPDNQHTLSSNMVKDITEDGEGNMLVATVNGLCLISKNNNKVYRYFNNELDHESINSNLVRSVYSDNHGDIWITTNSGVGKAQVKNFKTYSHSIYKNSISHNKVQYLCEDPTSNIWIATPKGIDVFDREKKQFRFIAGVTQNKKGLYGAPLFLRPDDNNGMWIGTWNGGLSYYNYKTHKINNPVSTPIVQVQAGIFSVLEDSKNNLWMSVPRVGVYVYNEKTGGYRNFTHINDDEKTLSSNWVYVIMEDSKSNIWFGTLNGLNLLTNFKNGTFTTYLEGVEIKHIVENSSGDLWIGTNMGLYRFEKQFNNFKRFDTDDGLPGNVIHGILEDQNHNLWVSTDKGLAKFEVRDDSITNVITYRREEGLTIGNFLERSCAILSDGTMVFGGTEGFCMFHPSDLKNDTLPPLVMFTGLKISNREIEVGQNVNGQVILQTSIITAKQLTLNYKNNSFAIKFSGIQYNMPQYNQFCYNLEGYDKEESEWHYTAPGIREVEYMNLPRGTYTFKIKAANSYGVWNNNPSELQITVLPPWWQTFWFISVVVVALVFSIAFIIRVRTYNLQKQKQKLQKIVEQRTEELREMNVILSEKREELEQQMEQLAAMNENVTDANRKLLDANKKLEIQTNQVEQMAQQLHEADQSKLRFFANISHEFRTPLTLIIGPLEKCLTLPQADWNKIKEDYLSLIHRNAKRLLRLVNQVIDFRKIEQGEKRLRVSSNNIVGFVNDVVEVFKVQAEQKNINLRVQSQLSEYDFWFDPDILEKILYNLISNAIKYTPKEGEVSIQLSVNNEQSLNNEELIINNENTENDQFFILHSSFLIIKVSDTGIGIKKENIKKIFERFYREETNDNYTIEGTGIGLSYTKELVELHKGVISAESIYGKGTSFLLEFPLGKGYFEDENIMETSAPLNLDYLRSMVDSSVDTLDSKILSTEEIQEEVNEYEKPVVLVVEDNLDLRNYIKNELQTNYKIHEADNGEKGMDLAVEHEPELIISDVMMPVMDGMQLCEKIKTNEHTSHIPVILLTAKEGKENMIKGFETGADDYITKPFDMAILKSRIKNLLQSRQLIKQKFSKSLSIETSEITHSVIDQKFIQKAVDVVEGNMHNYEFDNDAFVDKMDYSRSVVYKKMKSITGLSVSDFIRNIRLKAAAQLFLKGHDNITEVCYKVGFKHLSVFTRYFSKMFGKSPTAFIKDNLNKS